VFRPHWTPDSPIVAGEVEIVKASRIKSLLFFVLLFAVAALALEASYTGDQGPGADRQQQPVPQGQQQTTAPPARDQDGVEMPADR
jgi:hypothetical protein